MNKSLDRITSIVESLDYLLAKDQIALLSEISSLEKQLMKNDYKLSRVTQDRKITEKVLQTTMKDLELKKDIEKKQEQIEEINKKLLLQSEELKRQKAIIEEKSFVLEENLKKLELSYKELEQFAYIASHDLKSPLRTISNFAQLVKRRNYDILDIESKEFVDFIVSGAKQMHEVICDSLEYSRVGNNENSFRKTDLNNILEIVRFNLKKEIEEKRATIESVQLPTINVNKTSVLQLFQNLICNSIKFSNGVKPFIEISCEKIEKGFEFKLSDNGIGMDESYRDKAFLPFQRLNDMEKPGTGIGLAICKKIVKMHGGDISFQSKRGHGTTFVFTLFDNREDVSQQVKEEAGYNGY